MGPGHIYTIVSKYFPYFSKFRNSLGSKKLLNCVDNSRKNCFNSLYTMLLASGMVRLRIIWKTLIKSLQILELKIVHSLSKMTWESRGVKSEKTKWPENKICSHCILQKFSIFYWENQEFFPYNSLNFEFSWKEHQNSLERFSLSFK